MAHLIIDANAVLGQLLPCFLSLEFLSAHGLIEHFTLGFIQASNHPFAVLKLQDGQLLSEDDILLFTTRVAEKDPELTAQAQDWVKKALLIGGADFATLSAHCQRLNDHLTLRSHISGYSTSLADISLWGAIRGNKMGRAVISQVGTNLARWYHFIEVCSGSWASVAVDSFLSRLLPIRNAKSKAGVSFELKGIATSGPFVTRFPPEPSGYLHIGHGKAALLNDYFAHRQVGGTLICRFDDTNPSRESLEFQDSILEDLKMIDILPDKVSYSSDYFQDMYELAIKLINSGKAFADDSALGQGDSDRRNKLPSKRRDLSIEETLKQFAEMKTGSTEGQRWCIRARIAYDSPNGTLRDPVIYRCNMTPHHRTGTNWKIYPTYDFCAPILDSIEGVTLALRTNEYRDRNVQYEWFQDALSLRKVEIWDFSRMNFVRTVLSKRKLTKIVAMNKVWGWDDPRMPTIRGILRRGMTVPALREFILGQGPSRNILNPEWGAFWALNKQKLDLVAPRHVAIDTSDAVVCSVQDVVEVNSAQWPRHAKNQSMGTKTVLFVLDEEITLMGWGNALVRKIERADDSKISGLEVELHLEGDVKKTQKKVTWLARVASDMVKVRLLSFDYLITKDKLEPTDNLEEFLTPVTEFEVDAWADCNISTLQKGDIMQFERKGYYRLDALPGPAGSAFTFFEIPTK